MSVRFTTNLMIVNRLAPQHDNQPENRTKATEQLKFGGRGNHEKSVPRTTKTTRILLRAIGSLCWMQHKFNRPREISSSMNREFSMNKTLRSPQVYRSFQSRSVAEVRSGGATTCESLGFQPEEMATTNTNSRGSDDRCRSTESPNQNRTVRRFPPAAAPRLYVWVLRGRPWTKVPS